MPEDVVVIGAGGFGRETLDVIEAINVASDQPQWNVVGVVDDAPAQVQLDRLSARGYPHVGGLASIGALRVSASVVIAVGAPRVRARIAAQLDEWRVAFATLVHPTATVGSQVRLGEGTIVCGGVQLSTNLDLGRHVHVNPGAIIGHDSVMEDFVSVNPGAIVSGEVRVGAHTLVGAGAVILQGLAVGENAMIGASACVTRDVPAGTVVKGVPAR